MQVTVYNIAMDKVGTIELPDDVFASPVNEALLWEEVKAQRASRRRGTHKTKKRGEVSGGGAKPYKQKGTGSARQGSSRAPHFVGGGTVFGPQPRDYSYDLPKTARRAALRSVLSQRAKTGSIVVIEGFGLEGPKTRSVTEFLGRLGSSSALFLDVDNNNLRLSARNLPRAKYLPGHAVNVYDVLDHEKLVITRDVIDVVVEKAQARKGVLEQSKAA